MTSRILLAAALITAVPLAGCFDTSVEGCGGTGDKLASASGQLSPENETFQVPVTYDGNGSGIAASAAWRADEEVGGSVNLRLAGDPDTASDVWKSTSNQACRGWSGLEAGDYTVEAFYEEEGGDEVGPEGSQASPPTTIDVDVLVQVKG